MIWRPELQDNVSGGRSVRSIPTSSWRRTTTMLINLGTFLSRVSFTDSFPICQATRKRWLCTRRSSFCWEKRVAIEALLLVMAPFRTEAVLTVLHRNDPPWPRLDSALRNSPPRATRFCALCNDQILESWMNVACACDETRPYRSRKCARTQWARKPLILKRNLKLKLLGGSLATVNPPPPPCVRACLSMKGTEARTW